MSGEQKGTTNEALGVDQTTGIGPLIQRDWAAPAPYQPTTQVTVVA
jgi:hypothetical protein